MLHEAKIAYYAFDVIRLFVPYAARLKLLGFYYFFVCTLIRHVLLIWSGHTELLIRSGYAAMLFATSIGPAVAKATWRHCLSHFIDRVAARTCCAVNVLTSRISFFFSWPWWMGSVVKHNMLKTLCRIPDFKNLHMTYGEQRKLSEFYVFCTIHCNIIIRYNPPKYTFSKLIF